MKKLYDKSEIWFAVAAILLYVIPTANLRAGVGDASPVIALWLLALTALFAGFLIRNGLCEKYGLTRWPDSRRFLFFIPFVILGLLNLRNGARINYPGAGQLWAALMMLLVGFVEEIVFRGFLQTAMAKTSVKSAIIVSALTFGAGHIVNLLTGHGGVETFTQMAYAVAIGFAFAVVYHFGGSLWPCVITHSLIDVASVFANDEGISAFNVNLGPVVIIVLCLVYGCYVIYTHRTAKAQ